MTAPAAINNRYGALLLIAAAGVFTADVTVLRFLSPDVPFAQIIFFRSICQLLIVALWIGMTRPALFGSPRWPRLVLRGLTSLICWWLYYASFQSLDLALASTLTFTTSLFVVAMAPFVLGERIGLMRGLTTVLGFVGVLIASEVSGLTVKPGILFGLGSAFAAAILIFQNRVLARTEHTATIMFWIGLVASAGTMPAAVAGWTDLGLSDSLLLLMAGTLATLGMLLTVEAYRFGEVSALATFPYARILFALAIGRFVFAETASLRELTGAAVIMICGLLASEYRWRRIPGPPTGGTSL
ncbi:DMT family transporter [Maliponia aquimaris]|uniref:EamA-like transporter family protein n=1 Tax=Maliponia aquimaris TaxID=1673631 RepID=A0A238KZC5_9RHOB|nr:DMT family transporter [Maliponia aquimaris]SMX47931.1 EamA-like transporter family protein [Maliponia aquimaris]